ncbi:MAG: OmpA family protein [Pseudomonadota bacterium]
MSGPVKFLIALLALGVLGYFCIYRHAPMIEAAVSENVATALASANGSVTAAVSGRDVTLTGTVIDATARSELVTRVELANGVRVVNDELEIGVGDATEPALPTPPAAPAAPYSTVLTVEPGSVSIAGDVADTAAGEAINAALSNLFPGRDISSSAMPREGLGAPWPARMQGAMVALSQMTFGTAELTGDRLVVRGAVPTATVRRAVEGSLGELPGIDLDARIDIVPLAIEEQEEAVANCQSRFDDTLAGARILFATGSAEIDETSDLLLGRLAAIARACPLAQIEIGGHTDNTGDAAYNEYLSGERANAVRDNLIAHGIDAERLSAAGYGSRQPVANNATREGRERNRRIEMRVSVFE